MAEHWVYIIFFYLLGSCVGSFLNVVVWRLPRGMSLVFPGSHCPKCNHKLSWRENIPVFGWILLRGKCRFCSQPISSRYPIIEALTGLMFVFYYAMFFIAPSNPPSGPIFLPRDWPIFAMDLVLLSSLLAASLIDYETYTIPISLCYLPAIVGIVIHGFADSPTLAGNILSAAPILAMSLGGAIGLAISFTLLWLGLLPQSYSDGGPAMEIDKANLKEGQAPEFRDYSKAEVRAETRKEIVYLMPPLTLAATGMALYMRSPAIVQFFNSWAQIDWINGIFSAILGGMVGAFVVWFFRVAGSMVLGKEAMGLGDVHLMFGIGACLGALQSIVVFFVSPFFGILVAIYLLIFSTKRQVPFGPYLAMGTAFVMLFYGPIAEHLRPGMLGLAALIADTLGLR